MFFPWTLEPRYEIIITEEPSSAFVGHTGLKPVNSATEMGARVCACDVIGSL